MIHISTLNSSELRSIFFDCKSTIRALKEDDIILFLRYSTAMFSLLYRHKDSIVLTNMDGMEWWREKRNNIQKFWLFINERCGVRFNDLLIADRPQIANHYIKGGVKPSKIATIPYGTEAFDRAV